VSVLEASEARVRRTFADFSLTDEPIGRDDDEAEAS
jgi:hypothetical protein